MRVFQKKELLVDISDVTDNGIPYVMTNASTGEILPVFFLLHYMCNYITNETLIYYLYKNYIYVI